MTSAGTFFKNGGRGISLFSCRFPFVALFLFATALIAGCGRVGDPLPPIKHRALVPEALRVAQRGDELILSWPKPGVIALQQSKVTRADILRRDEKVSEPRRLLEDQFIESARIIGSIELKDILGAESRNLQFSDRLQQNGVVDADLRYRYAIRYVQTSGVPLPLSNYAFLEPVSKIARPPSELKVELSQTAIKINWNAPTANFDDSQPAAVIGYNVYRRTKNQPFSDIPINGTPVSTTSFEDRNFRFGSEYFYAIRSVSQGKEGVIESPISEEISLIARDTFAPEKPGNITGAAAAGIVSIFWPANAERDLKGYLIYRAERPGQARSEWVKLTPAPITATTFRDERAQPGKTYYYFIIAIDQTGNESEPSEGVEVEVLQ
jgi:hypothetical protein